MDEQRALLDQLMGKERDVPLAKRTNRQRHFTDPDVCKFHLLGLCPYSLFSNTKSDLGEHPNGERDDDDMKAMYDRAPEEEKRRYGYEGELHSFLRELVSTCDRKVQRNKERCDKENPDSGVSDEKIKRLVEIDDLIKTKTAESERLAEEGELDESQELLEQVESLRTEKLSIERFVSHGKNQKRNIVCEVSGNIMSSADNEERIMCHFQGKQYLGWKACRERLAEYREKHRGGAPEGRDRVDRGRDYQPRRPRGDSRDRGGGWGGDRGRDHRGYHPYNRRDRSWERRYGGGDRRRSRSRDRGN